MKHKVTITTTIDVDGRDAMFCGDCCQHHRDGRCSLYRVSLGLEQTDRCCPRRVRWVGCLAATETMRGDKT